MGPLSQTQVTALVAALGCVLSLIAFLIHDRQMAARSASGQPWTKPTQPLLMLVIATALSVVTAVLALQGR
ncbi:MAG: hypothetical protein FJX74_14460 [Armatimonadetes bacterium]|nr:hypothetical protein [Armatimonadota bacterium]